MDILIAEKISHSNDSKLVITRIVNLVWKITIILLITKSERKIQDLFLTIQILFPGTLTVNVSVLLLSLASPDESSLVCFCLLIDIRPKVSLEILF